MIKYKELKEKSKELEQKYKLNHYELLQRFMFERILERISVSKYQENFILKGGLLLSALFGIDNRTTRDMDTTIKGLNISKERMINVLNEILSIDLKDSVKFELIDITDIREDDEYGGNKYHLIGKLENLKINLDIDISTGDTVIPKELEYSYPSLFEDKKILIYTYNAETIIAEKIETILRRGQYNSRMKDYYDIHMFLSEFKDTIDINILKLSIKNTFDKRESFDYLKDYEHILEGIFSYDRIVNLWNGYAKKNKYANDIKFEEIIRELKEFISSLDIEIVAA
ncbi:MAG: nucleotidyl transferase AbiEii/AbiGii toxin family protein [Clostridia bacterium]|nr:nucleotidyl transferase AbiEii/AbiGii toxin family protein [Clostridia bacterium]